MFRFFIEMANESKKGAHMLRYESLVAEREHLIGLIAELRSFGLTEKDNELCIEIWFLSEIEQNIESIDRGFLSAADENGRIDPDGDDPDGIGYPAPGDLDPDPHYSFIM